MENQIVKTISAEEFKKKIDSNICILIDVRTQGEHEDERIMDSESFDISRSDFTDRINNLDKEKIYLVYCRSGARSSHAMEIMKQLDFKEVYNLDGGMMNWKY